jgi:hypothetical protein
VRNPIALLLIIALAAVLAVPFLSPASPPGPGSGNASAPVLCKDGQTRACSAGSCGGVSTCVGGVWSGCKWPRVCVPGSKVSCIQNGCAYAFKECDECGSGYGPCIMPSP